MKKPKIKASASRSRLASNLLLYVGAVAIGLWVWSVVRLEVYERRENRAFEIGVVSQPRTPGRVKGLAAVPAGGVVGRLSIPRLGLRAMVREGTDPDTLDVALGHIPGTAFPGQFGNVGVAGHRDTLFRRLREIARNDSIEFQTLAGTYEYQVDGAEIVQPQMVGVLAAGGRSELTLVTCYPFRFAGPAPERFAVKARLVSQSPPHGSPPLR